MCIIIDIIHADPCKNSTMQLRHSSALIECHPLTGSVGLLRCMLAKSSKEPGEAASFAGGAGGVEICICGKKSLIIATSIFLQW